MYLFIYFLVTLAATTAGAVTGVGGGVIIKPVLDAIGEIDSASINTLSCIAVFSMAVVSVIRLYSRKNTVRPDTGICLAVGSVVGGAAGYGLLAYVMSRFSDSAVVSIQNGVQAALVAISFIYMLKRSSFGSLKLESKFAAFVTGGILGVASSFLGVGGGPINVALIICVFGVEMKSAVVYSLIIILFAQISKLSTITLTTGFLVFDLRAAPHMVLGAVLGGHIGSLLNKRLDSRVVEIGFNCIQCFVLVLCVFNTAIPLFNH